MFPEVAGAPKTAPGHFAEGSDVWRAIARPALQALVVGLWVSVAEGADPPKAVLPDVAFHFGKVARGRVVEHDFLVRNDGGSPLAIHRVQMTTPLRVEPWPREIVPGADARVRFRLDTAELEGPFDGQVAILLNDPRLPEARFTFTGRIVPPVELAPMSALFVAAPRGQAKAASIEIINHEPGPLRIEHIEHSREAFTSDLETLEEGRRYRLTIRMHPDGPAGRHRTNILVRTSSPTTPPLRITAYTSLRERVYTFPAVVDLGRLRLADIQAHPDLLRRTAQMLMIYQAGGANFQVTARTDVPMLDLALERGPAGDRYQITATIRGDQLRAGPIRGSIVIETNDPDFAEVRVPVLGGIVDR
jgi:Protein of unknown function (DUF1573)